MTPYADVVVVDGLNVFIRHYKSNPSMSGNGYQMGGFVGFLKTVADVIRLSNPRRVIVAWEGGGSSKRRSINPNYKNKRKPSLEGMNRFYEHIPDSYENRNHQMATLINFLKKTPVEQIYAENAEADDAIAYVIEKLKGQYGKFLIVSSDRDFYQLIDDDLVSVWTPGRKKLVGEAECIEEFGIHPNNFALAKAIVGDRGDNVEGIKGCGYKYLVRWYPKFSEQDSIQASDMLRDFQRINESKNSKTIENILHSGVTIKQNLRLVSLSASSMPYPAVRRIENQLQQGPVELFSKIEMLRILMKEKLQRFDADLFYATLKQLAIKHDRRDDHVG